MTISAIQNDKTQNNITAISSGIIAGTSGAFAGYNFAPKYATKNMEEVLALKPDVFNKTINNMLSHSENSFLTAIFQLEPSKAIIERTKHNINELCPTDKVSVDKIQEFIETQQKDIDCLSKEFDDIITDLSSHVKENIKVKDYLKQLRENKNFPENVRYAIEGLVKNFSKTPKFNEKLPVSDLVEFLSFRKNVAERFTQNELLIYDEMLKLKKDGLVTKSDMINSANKNVKSIVDKTLDGVSFDYIKKFIPRKSQAKWATIVGGASALLTAIGVKIFKDS